MATGLPSVLMLMHKAAAAFEKAVVFLGFPMSLEKKKALESTVHSFSFYPTS